MTLAEFIAARLDEDEAVAKSIIKLADGNWRSDGPYLGRESGGIAAQFGDSDDAEHAARHDPVRVLREVAAKRAILTEHNAPLGYECNTCESREWPCMTLLLVANVWSDHPDFDPRWKVEVHKL